MAMTPEQFDAHIILKTAELTDAWKAVPPTETEVLTKVILDYQYKAATVIIDTINNMNAMNENRWSQIMTKLQKIEKDLEQEK
jgi:hypothetical protein